MLRSLSAIIKSRKKKRKKFQVTKTQQQLLLYDEAHDDEMSSERKLRKKCKIFLTKKPREKEKVGATCCLNLRPYGLRDQQLNAFSLLISTHGIFNMKCH